MDPYIGGHPAGHSVGHCVGRRAPGLLGRSRQRPPLSPPVARGSSCRPVSPRVARVAHFRPVSRVSPRRKLCPYFCPLASGQKYGQSCGGAVDKHRTSGRKAGFSGTPEIEVSCVSPAQKYDSWLQSCLNYTKFQESASRAVLGGNSYPLYFKNGVFLRDFHRGVR